MSLPSIVSYGAAAKTSSLVWDGDLVIPDGYAIESASGEVSISGGLALNGTPFQQIDANFNVDLSQHNSMVWGWPAMMFVDSIRFRNTNSGGANLNVHVKLLDGTTIDASIPADSQWHDYTPPSTSSGYMVGIYADNAASVPNYHIANVIGKMIIASTPGTYIS